MDWLQRYLDLFEGEPAWLILVVSVVMLTGAVVIVEKLLKFGIWILIAGVVAVIVMLGGVFFLYGF